MLTIQLSTEWENLLQQFAKKAGKNSEDYAKEIVMEYLGDMEDLYYAQRELEAVKAGTSKTVSLQEVMKEYGMDDQNF